MIPHIADRARDTFINLAYSIRDLQSSIKIPYYGCIQRRASLKHNRPTLAWMKHRAHVRDALSTAQGKHCERSLPLTLASSAGQKRGGKHRRIEPQPQGRTAGA